MHEEHHGGRAAREGQAAALTPRPLRLLLIGRVKPGSEAALRETQARFPCDAAIEAGIEAVEAYVGSGHYAVELEIGADDVQHVLATFFNDRRVREFRTELAPMVEVWQRLLAQHVPDRAGRCRTCTKGGTGLPTTPWPCVIHGIADMARRSYDARRGRAAS